MILKCSKVPDVILQQVISRDGLMLEQLHLIRNEFISDDVIKILYDNTIHSFVREDA